MNPTQEMLVSQVPYTNMMDTINSQTNQRELDIRNDWQKTGAAQQQGLTNLGMSNTTVAPTMAAGNSRYMQEDLNRNADSVTDMKLGVHLAQQDSNTGYANMYSIRQAQQQQNQFSGIMGREDTYPNENLYASLMQQGGASQTPSPTINVNTGGSGTIIDQYKKLIFG